MLSESRAQGREAGTCRGVGGRGGCSTVSRRVEKVACEQKLEGSEAVTHADNLEKVCSRQREQSMRRPQVKHVPEMF